MELKTLFITLSFLNGNGGGIYASRTHINLFSEISKSMTLLYPYKKGKESEGINVNKIEMIPIEDYRSKFKKGIDLCLGKVHRFINIAKKYANPKLYNLVVFDSSVVSSGLISIFKECGIKTITIHHNYQIEYLLGDCSFITLIPNLFWTWIYERQAVKNSNLNITLTNQDCELLAKHYDKNAKYSVLGVFEYQRKDYPFVENRKRRNKFIITGSLATKQTEDSLILWINNYYPILKKIIPDSELTIAGRNPSEKLKDAIISAGIKLIASPPDMFSILIEHDYYICPTDRGGGLKLRIMDGFKAGLPVLSHNISARGYEKLIEEGILYQYDNIETFARGIQSLSEITFLHEEIQKKYISQYNFDKGIAKLRSIIHQIK